MGNAIALSTGKPGRLDICRTSHSLAVSCLLIGALAGCAVRPFPGTMKVEYTDPLAEIAVARGNPVFSSVSLGVIFSENTRKGMELAEGGRALLKKYRNRAALEDTDPAYVTKRLGQILENRFRETVAVKDLEEAKVQNVDLVMVLDTRAEVGLRRRQKTSVHIGGIFMETDGTLIDTISGDGAAKVTVFPTWSPNLKPAASVALKEFAEKLDGSGKLVAALKDWAGEAKLAAVGSAEPSPVEGELASIRVPGDVSFGDYHALVIGIDGYRALPRLRTAVNDARSVAKALKDDYGFKTRLLLDATRADILNALGEFRRELTPRDNLLIYYAGHGWLDEEADAGYWLPVDATRDSEVNWVPNASVTSAVKAIPAKHVLIVADSCYSGKLTRGLRITRRTRDYFARIAGKRARLELASGGLEPVADAGGEGRHSVFASAFLQALRENEGVMDGTQLFTRIRRPVMVNSDQAPEYADIRKAGHAGGDFLFVRGE